MICSHNLDIYIEELLVMDILLEFYLLTMVVKQGLEFREDIQTVLEPGMVVSMEPMVFIPEGEPGAGGYREHDILVVKEKNAENITTFPFGPKHNIIKN